MAFIVGVVDALVAYSNFRMASYSKPLAVLAALAFFFFVAVAHLLLTPVVKNAKTQKGKVVCIVAILIIGFFIFFSMAEVRTDGLNKQILLPDYAFEIQSRPAKASPWPICAISYGLFVGVFFASLLYYKNKEEQTAIENNKTIRNKLTALNLEIKTLQKQNKIITEDIKSQKDQAREIFAYCKSAILQAKNNGDLAIKTYMQTYADYSDSIPTYFNDTHNLAYNENINFFKSEN